MTTSAQQILLAACVALAAAAPALVGEGDLFITVHVDETGVAQATDVCATPGSRVSREVAKVLMVKYKPGRCAGKPCSSEFPFTARLGSG